MIEIFSLSVYYADMGEHTTGATYGDALVALIEFAERSPWRFLITVPVTLGLVLVFVLVALKLGVLGPLAAQKARYDTTRTRNHVPPNPRLPL